MSEKHTCPRRAENGMDSADSPFVGGGQDLDSYTSGHGMTGQKRGCSYCGSMSPEDFMNAVRAGVEIGPTDKNYKAYVSGMTGKFYFQHLSVEQKHEFIDLLNKGEINIGYPGHFYARPFFIATGKADAGSPA